MSSLLTTAPRPRRDPDYLPREPVPVRRRPVPHGSGQDLGPRGGSARAPR